MKGTVVSSWVQSCRKLFGDKVVDDALHKYELSKDHIFTPLQDVEDRVATGIVDSVGDAVGKNHKEIWLMMGEENIKTFSKNYPGFFRNESAYQFLKSMNDVHAIVMKRFKGATPPVLDVEPISSHECTFTYRSKRGMGDYLAGMINGVAHYFNEEIKVEEIKKDSSEIQLRLTFEKEIQLVKRFRINQIFSFGVLRNVSIKTAIANTILMALVSFITTGDGVDTLLLSGATFIVSLLSTVLFHRPRKLVEKELQKLSERNFVETLELHSNDEYEELMNSINQVKKRIQKDFIGFNSMVDEMYTFNNAVSEITATMRDASNDITEVLEQVANAAITQAEDTEGAIRVLDGSITSLSQISDSGQENKEHIENTMVQIEHSFRNVQKTASEINQVLNKFDGIRKNSNELKDNADNITKIVSIVAAIANQINLLALNASIEAARAGEMGKGFAVVADEIKNLSNDTNKAVKQINGSLTEFVLSIGEVVEDIDEQYKVLEKENTNLKEAVDSSENSNNQLRIVSDMMIQTSQNLKIEADHIAELFDGISNLSVIAEENSASTQEASSNVTIYVEQINELKDQIGVFEAMIKNFREDLSKFKI
ncbi:heme NO-binding domain-containing protein [Anaeromicropila herbilytica]|uniref:Methyl-accepting chemotaxis protein n=1 Tax=Anaeromicropila herbilytica TaxID=2785025 RepID=A0A7R7ENX4_9FIRM|nr:heme NO-binding domain-containing protein [Anaeromicropila herbilytica]BCN31952.1 methyl-accepting chemotaxis protein [Anaeromicropila herbilytica]